MIQGRSLFLCATHSVACYQLVSHLMVFDRVLHDSRVTGSFSILFFTLTVCVFEVGRYYATETNTLGQLR
ncbi:hypothetical protein EDC04DRAFT_2650392 [Pisolithus marmoratus]|nr:hypothetical protein EDC04DRAFT_2650392 [Pisolithus marmoratus]